MFADVFEVPLNCERRFELRYRYFLKYKLSPSYTFISKGARKNVLSPFSSIICDFMPCMNSQTRDYMFTLI